MRLNSISLENWSCHDRLEADLTEGLQILGRNGTGKTSILEAIRFVFRKTASGYTSRIKNGARSATVRLAFSHDGRKYFIEKRIHVEKPSTALMTCDETQIADNATSVYNSLKNILSEDVLDKLLYVPQGGLTGILDQLSGREGKVEMDRLFGLDKLELVWLKAGEELRGQEVRVSVLADQLKKHPEDAGESYVRQLDELVKQRGELEAKLNSTSDARSKVDSDLKGVEGGLERMNEVKKEIESLNKQLNEVNISLAEVVKEDESLTSRLRELEDRQRMLDGLKSRKSGLEKYAALRQLLLKLRDVESRLSEVKVGGEEGRLAELESILRKKPAAEAKYGELEKQVRALEKEHAQRTVDVEKTVEFLNELASLDGRAKCPRCGQRLTALHLNKEKQDTAERLKKMYANLKKIELELVNINARYEALKASVEEYRKDDVEYAQLRKRLERVGEEKAGLVEQQEAIKNELASKEYGGETLECVEERVAELNQLDGSMRELQREIESREGLNARKSGLMTRKNGLESGRNRINERLKQLQYDPARHEKQSAERDRLSSERYRLDAECSTLKADLNRLDERRLELEKTLNEYRQLQLEHGEAERRARKLAQAREIFHRDRGLVKYLREHFTSSLNTVLTHYYGRFNQNPKFLSVSFSRDYDIQFKTTSGMLSLDQVSGGEKIQLALALRIALIELMSPVRLLILDEPFGSLDEPHREVLGEALTNIAEAGQLILVTHVNVEGLQLHNKLELEGY